MKNSENCITEFDIQSPNSSFDANLIKVSLKEFLEAKGKENGCGIIASSLNFADGGIEYQKAIFGTRDNIINLVYAILSDEIASENPKNQYAILCEIRDLISEKIAEVEEKI